MELSNFSDAYLEKNNIRSDDRTIVIRPMEGKPNLSSTGLVDARSFADGSNNLHAIKDPQFNLWYLKLENGALPPALKGQKFTKFDSLLEFTKKYFATRNLEVVEVID
jgi:hypothetical protein